MSNNKLWEGKHLTIEDRILIEYALDQNYLLKESKINRFVKVNNKKGKDLLRCEIRKNLCNSTCNNLCKKCTFINCYRTCTEYSPNKRSKITRFPYVCNCI